VKKLCIAVGMAAVLLTGCGEETPTEQEQEQETVDTRPASCADIETVVAHVRSGLGSCTANYMNEEPLAFNRALCDEHLATYCSAAAQVHVRAYVNCLGSVAACVPAQQASFDEAIDTCLDTFQNSGAGGGCIELVVGD
jgi:hypothetical protein